MKQEYVPSYRERDAMGPEVWVPTAALLVGGLLGYFGKRFVEKTYRTEELDRAAKLVALHSDMKQQGISPEDLRTFEAAITERRPKLRAIEDALVTKAGTQQQPQPTAIVTQAELNTQSSAALESAQRALKESLSELQSEMNEAEKNKLDSVQDYWTKYSEGQTELLASIFANGSMQPMMYAVELERMTIQRLAELQDYKEVRHL